MRSKHTLRLVPLCAAVCLLAACSGRDEKGLDFAKTQREALDKAKALGQAVQDAAARRADDGARP